MLLELALSGVSVGSATCLTNPIDVIKTRLQLQHLQGHAAMRRMGMVETAQALVRQEGVTALWKGLTPALARGFVYGGLRLGLYSPVKQLLATSGPFLPTSRLPSSPAQLPQPPPHSPPHHPFVPAPPGAQAPQTPAPLTPQPPSLQHSLHLAPQGSTLALLPTALASGPVGPDLHRQERAPLELHLAYPGSEPQPQAGSGGWEVQGRPQDQLPGPPSWAPGLGTPAAAPTLQLSLSGKVLAGMLSGGLAAALTSPTELVKTRLQSRTNTLCSPWQVVRQVVAEQGVHGLWKGALPGMVRASLLTASQCATYDEVKRRVMHNTGWADGTATQLACSLVTGLVTTTITNPVDVVKTTLYVSGDRYSGALRAAADILRREGPRGLLSGWVANYTRLGPQTMVTFLVAERLRVLAGLDSL